MKIDFGTMVVVAGLPVKLDQDKEATLGDVCRLGLNTTPPDEKHPLESMLTRGRLAMRVGESKILDLSAEEISLIKQNLVKAFSHPEMLVVVCDLLDPVSPVED